MLPYSYTARNVVRAPARLVQLVVGTALVVLLVVAAAAFQAGMTRSLRDSGDPTTVMLLGLGSENSQERSAIFETVPGVAAAGMSGVATVRDRPLVSGEIYHMGLLGPARDDLRQGLVRGVGPLAVAVHGIEIIAGRFPGPDEIMLGRRAAGHLGLEPEQARLGAVLYFEDHPYVVSGWFSAGGSLKEAECWLDVQDLMARSQRQSLSVAMVRMSSFEDVAEAELFATRRLDLEVAAVDERSYYRAMQAYMAPVRMMVWATAILIALAATMGGLNTLYTAFIARRRECAVLQVLGFRPWMIFLSLLLESLLATALGTSLALVLALVLLDGQQVVFTLGVFELILSPGVLLLGLATGLGLGALGMLTPALRCLGGAIPDGLRSA